MDYSLVFIFDEPLQNVLLIRKMKGPHPGKLNGVGGKIEQTDASDRDGALRELGEETSLQKYNLREFEKLLEMKLPDGVTLHVFYGVSDTNNVVKREEEPVNFYPVNGIRSVRNTLFAGDGEVQFFINMSVNILRKKRENPQGKKYNCPDCQRTDSCNGCFRAFPSVTVTCTNTSGDYRIVYDPITLTYPQSPDNGKTITYTPHKGYVPYTGPMPYYPNECCRKCGNHPDNGGSGVCNCILGQITIY